MGKKIKFIGLIFMILILASSSVLAATTTSEKTTYDNIVEYKTSVDVGNNEFMLINLLTIELQKGDLKSICQYNPYNYKLNNLYTDDVLNMCSAVTVTYYKATNEIVDGSGIITGYGYGNTTELEQNTVEWSGYGMYGPGQITFTAELDYNILNDDFKVKSGITGIEKMKTRYTFLSEEVSEVVNLEDEIVINNTANQTEVVISNINETSIKKTKTIEDKQSEIENNKKTVTDEENSVIVDEETTTIIGDDNIQTTEEIQTEDTETVNNETEVTETTDNETADIEDIVITEEENKETTPSRLSTLPAYVYAVAIIVLLIILFLIFRETHGGMPWCSKSRRAMNLHKRAEKAYKKGKHSKSRKLYNKANKIRLN